MTDTRTLIGPLGVWGHRSIACRPLSCGPSWPVSPSLATVRCGSGRVPAVTPSRSSRPWPRPPAPMALGTSIVNIFGRDRDGHADGCHDAARADRRALRAGPRRLARAPRAEAARPRLREAADAHARVPRGLRAPALSRAGASTGPDGAADASHRCSSPRLRPRMLELAASATDGTLPFFVIAERIAWMRERARSTPRRPTGRVRSWPRPWPWSSSRPTSLRVPRLVPGWCRTVVPRTTSAAWPSRASGPTDWEPPYSDRLVDALVAWGRCRAGAAAHRRVPRGRRRPRGAVIPAGGGRLGERLAGHAGGAGARVLSAARDLYSRACHH